MEPIIICACSEFNLQELCNENKYNFEYIINNYLDVNYLRNSKKHLIIINMSIRSTQILVNNNFKFILVLPSENKMKDINKNGIKKLFCEEMCFSLINKYNNFPIYIINIGNIKDNMEGIIKKYKEFYYDK